MISYGEQLSCYTDINTKGYKTLTLVITSYTSLTNVKITNDVTTLGTYTANGTYTLDVTDYDSVRLASTGKASVYNGTAVITYTLSV